MAGEQPQARRGIVPGCALATALFQLLLLGPLRERAACPTVSICVVVDDLSLQRFGDHYRVAPELELASTCLGQHVTQVGRASEQSPIRETHAGWVRGAHAHVQGPEQLSLCGGQSCRCGWRRSVCRRQGRSTSGSNSHQEIKSQMMSPRLV